MATVQVNGVELRPKDQLDVWAFETGGKVILAVNITIESNGSARITYSKPNTTSLTIDEVGGE